MAHPLNGADFVTQVRVMRELRLMDGTPASPREDGIVLANMSPQPFYRGICFPGEFAWIIARKLFFGGCSKPQITGWGVPTPHSMAGITS